LTIFLSIPFSCLAAEEITLSASTSKSLDDNFDKNVNRLRPKEAPETGLKWWSF
jgi:hypothetical protein